MIDVAPDNSALFRFDFDEETWPPLSFLARRRTDDAGGNAVVVRLNSAREGGRIADLGLLRCFRATPGLVPGALRVSRFAWLALPLFSSGDDFVFSCCWCGAFPAASTTVVAFRGGRPRSTPGYGIGKRAVTSFDKNPRPPAPPTPSRVVLSALERFFAAELLGTRFGFFVIVDITVVPGAREEVDVRRYGDSGPGSLTFPLDMMTTSSGGGGPLKVMPSIPTLQRAARAARIF